MDVRRGRVLASAFVVARTAISSVVLVPESIEWRPIPYAWVASMVRLRCPTCFCAWRNNSTLAATLRQRIFRARTVVLCLPQLGLLGELAERQYRRLWRRSADLQSQPVFGGLGGIQRHHAITATNADAINAITAALSSAAAASRRRLQYGGRQLLRELEWPRSLSTWMVSGNANRDACAAACSSSSDCSGFEWYNAGWNATVQQLYATAIASPCHLLQPAQNLARGGEMRNAG